MLLRRHGGALKADLRREYQVDILDLYRGLIGIEDVADLVAYLPPGSAVWREHGGPAAWTDAVAMGAQVEHAVRMAHWARTEDAKHNRNRPEPLRPPEDVITAERKQARARSQLDLFIELEHRQQAARQMRG
ncbi:DUF5361 domain-containing protein [Georgenia sp. MJ170]|uniref:DUF5361 domain-containing protein n=1 Tax=Georgenia sunbinii TaxID=3117728 RepID=UPI002F26CB75